MKVLRIEAALVRYNELVTPDKRITKQQLAVMVIPDNGNPDPVAQIVRKRSMLSRWLKGSTNGLTPEVVVNICRVLHVDPNFLYGYKKE